MLRASRPMEGLVIDFCGPFPVRGDDSTGCDYCLVVIDIFTRWMFLCPTVGNSSAAAVGALWNHVVIIHGAPDFVHSDRGSHFTSSVISHFESRFGICHTYPASKNPRVQGAAERAVRELKTSLRLLQPYLLAREDWKDALPVVSFVHNTSPPPYIPAYYDLTPYELLFGRSAPDIYIGNRHGASFGHIDSPHAYLDDLQRRLQDAHDLWSVTRDIELTKRNDRYRVGSLQRSYDPGDKVLRVVPIERPGGHSTEVTGPYEIIGPAGQNHYKVRGTTDRLPVHQLRPLTLDPIIRRGLQQDSSINRASSVLYEQKLLTVAKDHLTAGDLIIHEIESFDLEHFDDCATVISNNLSKAELEIRIMEVDDTGRWSLTNSTQVLSYHSIVATGFALTKQNRTPFAY
ncbi:retrovirus polyprotein, putative [Perkinsus marinus ATCC 50983]|uniref:Retrovirus polyprotein, putative n=1 Tax=Perkinsus marinus (strain ATCC 50983 / TXsc) TaxID=423536 RepID=C5LTA6_PERM5|nr:retrovirus polyprotein, putative [Perkinsus marinus ATCC 50983]EER00074.1 retrovirus polyprotein, putative [Perkinsus marinus ATCC 50983]|eukprot:XP_002767356.1 retrovirus polyprotein, putative [Perkinsus marinus ATCC 50983]